MRKTRHFVAISIFSVLLSGCSFDFEGLKSLFKKAAKETMDLIVVSDEKKVSLQEDTKNLYGVEFELTSKKPFVSSLTEVIDIATTSQENYLTSLKDGMAIYEQNNGHSNITQEGYFSVVDKYLKYKKGEDTFTIQVSGDSYIATKNDAAIDVTDPDAKDECDKSYSIWDNQMKYCFSYELNALINLKARLTGSTVDENSNVDFLTKVQLKDYRDAGNYKAIYSGEAHKNEGSNDITIDYIEAKYVDYRLQYTLLHSFSVSFDSLIETHKLSYTKFIYNVNIEDCFKSA